MRSRLHWKKATCQVCGSTYEYLREDQKPKTCGRFDCLRKGIRSGLLEDRSRVRVL